MGDQMSTISLLHNGFIICLTLAVVCFLAAILLFFVLDIKTIFLLRTGKLQKKAIEQIQQDNTRTGTLSNKKRLNFTGEFTDNLKSKKLSSYNPPTKDAEQAPATDTQGTSVLSQTQETALLMRESGATEQLVTVSDGVASIQQQAVQTPNRHNSGAIRFTVVKCLVLVHTNESIA
ncbi:MAG: hypothetical protein QM689_11280 [Oscillospiraceae bacterium]